MAYATIPASAFTTAHPCERLAAVPDVRRYMVEPPFSAKLVVELTPRNGGVHAWVAPAVVSMRKLREAKAGFAVLFVRTTVVCQPPPSTTWGIMSVCADCPNTGSHERTQRSRPLPFVMVRPIKALSRSESVSSALAPLRPSTPMLQKQVPEPPCSVTEQYLH